MTIAREKTPAGPSRVVDIAGTSWPRFKIEALVAGILVFVIAFALVQDLQPAVLAAAAVTAVGWIVGSARQASRSQ